MQLLYLCTKVHGKKPSKDPLSYRPISLTSCLARVFEKALNMQIRKYFGVNKLIYDHQSGFLPQHSTVTQLCYPANPRTNNGSGSKAVHSSGYPGCEQGIQPGAYCGPALGVGSLRIL